MASQLSNLFETSFEGLKRYRAKQTTRGLVVTGDLGLICDCS